MLREMAVGVVALGLSASGLLAVAPAVDANERRVQVIRAGEGRAFLGVTLKDVGSGDLERLKLGEERGAVVGSVEPDSAAEQAGVQEGDVILGYQGQRVLSATQLARLVRESPAGRTVAIEVSRGGTVRTLSATLGERKGRHFTFGFDRDFHVEIPEPPEPPEHPKHPEPPEAPEHPVQPHMRWSFPGGDMEELLLRHRGPRKLGIGYQEISGQLAEYFELAEGPGILVTEVEEDGAAFKAGIKAGDVIVAFAGERIEGSRHLRRLVQRSDPGEKVTVELIRDGKPLELELEVGGETKPRQSGKVA